MINTNDISAQSLGFDSNNELKLEAGLVLDCLDEQITIISKDFKILFANAMFLQKVGKKKDEVIGKFCYEITHKRSSICEPPNDPCPIITMQRTHQPSIEIHTHFDTENKSFLVNVVAAPIIQNNICIGYLHMAKASKSNQKQEAEMDLALKKAFYKPSAWFRGILFPLCEVS